MLAVLETGLSSTLGKSNNAVRSSGGTEANDSDKSRLSVGNAQAEKTAATETTRPVEPASESNRSKPLPPQLQAELDRERDIAFGDASKERTNEFIQNKKQNIQRLEARRAYEQALAQKFDARRAYEEAQSVETQARINEQDVAFGRN